MTTRACSPDASRPPSVDTGARIHTLQLGAGWFPEAPGGLDRYYYELVRELPTVGVDVTGLVVGSDRVAADSDGRVTGFAPGAAPLPTRWRRARAAIARVLAHERPALVASHFALYAAPAMDMLRRIPVVIHFHGPWGLETQAERARALAVRAKLALERAVYARGDAYVVLSAAFGRVLAETYGVAPERIHLIPGGVQTAKYDVPLTRAEAREALGWPADRPIVLAVRRLARRMGLENLVAAAARVRERFPDALILIAGKGALAGELAAQIDAAGLRHHVRLLGFVPDEQLPLAYRAANLSIVPTIALEGFGLIAVESLAAGTPTMVTPVGGLPEVVAGLSCDLILAGTGADDIAEGITGFLAGARRGPEPAACRDFARSRYDWSVVAPAVRRVYEGVLA